MARALLQEDKTFWVDEKELDVSIPVDDEVRYALRPLTRDVIRATTKRYTRQIPNPRTHQREDQLDWDAVQEELLDHCIVEWIGILEAGQPAPCDRAHKRTLPIAIQAALIARAQIGEGAGSAQSFREPARVL